ncbi:MAG: endonuclease [Flavobacteriales bacterium]
MEGPSLFLAREQLKPFMRRKVLNVSGNTKIEKERFQDEVVKDIFVWGKHLVFQFDRFALKVHFLLFGTFEAEVNGIAVTGDYKRARVPRLAFTFANGAIRMYNCSVRIIEDAHLKRSYDFSVDVLSRAWDPAQALKNLKENGGEEIADVLLDQDIFAGVGNIIKNEVLSLVHIQPEAKVGELSVAKRKEIVAQARSFSRQFLKWRRVFMLRKNLKVHRRAQCPYCGGKLTHQKTGRRARMSHYCLKCQKRSG